MTFEDLGLIVMPLLALLIYRLLLPLPDRAAPPHRDSTAEITVRAEEASEAERRRPAANRPRTVSVSLMPLAPLLLLGAAGYLLVVLIRGIGLPHRS